MTRPKTDWALMERIAPHARRVLYYGPPGTGKSTTAQSGRDDDQIVTVSLHDETTVAELLGHFVPVGDRFIWLDGPALLAWRNGLRLVLDEIDLASGAVLSVCRGLLNDARVARLTIPNAAMAGMTDEELAECIMRGDGLETVRPAEGFQVVGTMNGEPEDLDAPLRERFDARFYVGVPHPNAIRALPAALRATAERTAIETNEDRYISVRTWHNFVNLTTACGSYRDAAFAVFGARSGDILDGLRLGGADLDAVFAAHAAPAAEAAFMATEVDGEVRVTASGKTLSPVTKKGYKRGDYPRPTDTGDGLVFLSREDLRKLCREAGLSVAGHKAVVIERLRRAGVSASTLGVTPTA